MSRVLVHRCQFFPQRDEGLVVPQPPAQHARELEDQHARSFRAWSATSDEIEASVLKRKCGLI